MRSFNVHHKENGCFVTRSDHPSSFSAWSLGVSLSTSAATEDDGQGIN
jgi:hypothetical protein